MHLHIPLRYWSIEYLHATFHNLWILGSNPKLLVKIHDEIKRRRLA